MVDSKLNNYHMIMDYSSQHIYKVSDLTKEVRLLLEASYPAVWIEGEISNLARPASGHLYFTLKDEKSQVRCAFFRNRMNRLDCKPENGMHVHVKAQVSLYENRGDFQLIVSHLEEAGAGDLQAAFEKLKLKLKNEGLFSAEYKKPLPPYPKSIGIITSATGAVINDIISTCERRYPVVSLVLYPVQVQGEQAANDIIDALKIAEQKQHDVLIIGRGGGSLEDLWAFNNELLARAIFSCKTPLISAVGHDVDFTIADFVADVRAPTPTAAAELATADGAQLILNFEQFQNRLALLLRNKINHLTQQTDILTYRLSHPSKKLSAWKQFNAQLQDRLRSNITHKLSQNKLKINNLSHLVKVNSPKKIHTQTQLKLDRLRHQLEALIKLQLDKTHSRVESTADKLTTVSPQSTLERGYAIVTTLPGNEILRSVQQVKPASSINIQLADGDFKASNLSDLRNRSEANGKT